MDEQRIDEVQEIPAENEAPAQEQDFSAENDELRAALLEANIKLALLLSGAAKEKLSEAARLAQGLCSLGAAPDEAAAEVISGYPHLKAVQREIPQFAAQTGGSDDGFSLIRSIFSKR